MDVKEAVERRRAYRSLEPVGVTQDLVDDLARTASLAPSCFNNQPWRFVFVKDPGTLEKLREAFSAGNEWARAGSLVVAVSSRKDLDCVVAGREYHLFDTGVATAFLILRATELGLVAHPIAGFKAKRAKEILAIPDDMTLITLVVMGKQSGSPSTTLSEKQLAAEQARPERLPPGAFAFVDRFNGEGEEQPG